MIEEERNEEEVGQVSAGAPIQPAPEAEEEKEEEEEEDNLSDLFTYEKEDVSDLADVSEETESPEEEEEEEESDDILAGPEEEDMSDLFRIGDGSPVKKAKPKEPKRVKIKPVYYPPSVRRINQQE